MIALIVCVIIAQAATQTCLDQSGEPVEWWVIFKVPPKTGFNSFGYYDSRMKSGELSYFNYPLDIGDSALAKTIDLFNLGDNSRVAWNDEKPSGQTSSTVAHSKGFIGFSVTNKKGFFISHSIPKYPAFSDGKIVKTISPSQQIYGQHLTCFSLTLGELETLAYNLLVIKPYIYEGQVDNTPETENLYKLSQSVVLNIEELFLTTHLRSNLGYGVMSIFKNHKVNGSIFQDGLTNFLGVTPLIAETWGRPLASSWCTDDYEVNNAQKIKVGEVTWNQSDDHSKWVLAGDDYACFGDMNRMTSQWKRGGAFYCLNDRTLISAVRKTLLTFDECSSTSVHLSSQ